MKQKDNILVALTSDGALRVYVAVTTELVSKAQKIHNSYPIATAALGRALTGAAIMGAMEKNENASITLQFKGDGPLGTIITVSNAKAEVRGYAANSGVELPLKPNGKLDVGGAVGKNGFLNVVRDSGVGEPYVGQVPLATGEIAEDLTLYYATSEQTPTAIALGVLVDVDFSAKAAGGYVIQLMPGRGENDDLILNKIEDKIKTIPPISSMIANGLSDRDIMAEIMGDLDYNILDEVAPKYKCNCSESRVERALISIGAKELQEIIDDGNETEINCNFCDKKYVFSVEDIADLLDKINSKK